MNSLRRHRNIDAQLSARVVRQARQEALSVVLVSHLIAGDARLEMVHLLAALYRSCSHARAVVVPVVQSIADDRPDPGTGGRAGNAAVALTEPAAQQAARNAADDRSRKSCC